MIITGDMVWRLEVNFGQEHNSQRSMSCSFTSHIDLTVMESFILDKVGMYPGQLHCFVTGAIAKLNNEGQPISYEYEAHILKMVEANDRPNLKKEKPVSLTLTLSESINKLKMLMRKQNDN